MVQTDRGKQDMDAVRDEVSAMEQEEIDLRAKRLAEMADAYWRAILGGVVSSLLGLGLTGVVGFLILRSEAARRREDWLQTGRVGLSKAMLGDQPINQLGDNILGYALKPVKHEDLTEVFKKLETRLAQRMRRVIIVEDDAVQRDAVQRLLGSHEVETVPEPTAMAQTALRLWSKQAAWRSYRVRGAPMRSRCRRPPSRPAPTLAFCR